MQNAQDNGSKRPLLGEVIGEGSPNGNFKLHCWPN